MGKANQGEKKKKTWGSPQVTDSNILYPDSHAFLTVFYI